ncbi:MAG: hypothetical protein ABSE68_01765 [Minisyncoccia bacterium]
MKWEKPPVIKIYEALSTIADGRIEVSENEAKVYSSSGNKFYNVKYSPDENAIVANDNGSYWKGYLGYPSIAFLIKAGVLGLRPDMADLLKGIKWKDINTKFKNDFNKTLDYIESSLNPKNREDLKKYVELIGKTISKLDLNVLNPKIKPPIGY